MGKPVDTLNSAIPSTRLARMRVSTRRWRGWFAWLALITFAFAQLAVAAYVCPNTVDAAEIERVPPIDGECHRTGPHSDADNAQLCKAYCERGAQVKPSSVIDPPDLAHIALPALIARPALNHAPNHSHHPWRASHGDPPLYLRNCVLRN